MTTIKVRKISDFSFGVTVSALGFPEEENVMASVYAAYTDGDLIVIKSDTFKKKYQAKYDEIEIDGSTYASLLLAADLLNQFIGNFKKGGSSSGTTVEWGGIEGELPNQQDLQAELDRIEAIANGAHIALVFDDQSQLDAWFAGTYERPDGVKPEDLKIGEEIYLRNIDEPDYWWDGERLIAKDYKTDLSNYYNKQEADRIFAKNYYINETVKLNQVKAGDNLRGKTILFDINSEDPVFPYPPSTVQDFYVQYNISFNQGVFPRDNSVIVLIYNRDNSDLNSKDVTGISFYFNNRDNVRTNFAEFNKDNTPKLTWLENSFTLPDNYDLIVSSVGTVTNDYLITEEQRESIKNMNLLNFANVGEEIKVDPEYNYNSILDFEGKLDSKQNNLVPGPNVTIVPNEDGTSTISALEGDVVHKSGNETIAGVKTFTDLSQFSRAMALADRNIYVFYGNPLPSIWEDAKVPIAKPNQFDYYAWDKISFQGSLTNGDAEDWQDDLMINYSETNRRRLTGGDANSGISFRITDADNNPYVQRVKVEIDVDPTSGNTNTGRMWLNDLIMMGSFVRTSWNMKVQAMRVGSTDWTDVTDVQYNRKTAEFIAHVSHPTLYFGNNTTDYNKIRIIFYDFQGLSSRMPNSTGVFWKMLWFGVYPNKLNKPVYSTDELGNVTFNGAPRSTSTYMPSRDSDLVNKMYVDNLLSAIESSAFSFKGFVSTTIPTIDLREGLLWYNTTGSSLGFPNVNFPWSTAIYQNGSWGPNSTGYTPDAGDLWADLDDDASSWYYAGDRWHKLDFNGSTFNPDQFDTSSGVVTLKDGIVTDVKVADNANINPLKISGLPFLRANTTDLQGDVSLVTTSFMVSTEGARRVNINGLDVAYTTDLNALDSRFQSNIWFTLDTEHVFDYKPSWILAPETDLIGRNIYQVTKTAYLDSSGGTVTEWDIPHGITNLDTILKIEVTSTEGYGDTKGRTFTAPYRSTDGTQIFNYYTTPTNIHIEAVGIEQMYSTYITLWYLKNA